jgi:uncharacterized protein (TIGR02266 family)
MSLLHTAAAANEDSMTNLPAIFLEYKRLDRVREEAGLTLAELESWTRLKRILTTHFKPGTDGAIADKQASLRVPYRVRVAFESVGELRQSLMLNISRGGVFLATPKPLAIGTRLLLRLQIGDGRTIELGGEVASINTGADMRSEAEGMGICFASLTDEQQKIVNELYGRAIDEVLEG